MLIHHTEHLRTESQWTFLGLPMGNLELLGDQLTLGTGNSCR
jgi:hypothetical protein